MIKLTRPAEPHIHDGETKRAKTCAQKRHDAYQSEKRAVLAGQEYMHKPDYKKHPYRYTKEVEELLKSVHYKCAYCEDKLDDKDYDQLDHYRPKGSKINLEPAFVGPQHGYWWLSWEWNNFLPLCAGCNGKKHENFPLSTTKRIPYDQASSTTDIHEEEPLLINPFDEDPAEHIEFYVETPADGEQFLLRPKNRSRKGNVTIYKVLDRNTLRKAHKNHIEDIQEDLRSLLKTLRPEQTLGNFVADFPKAMEKINKRTGADAKFSLLSRRVIQHFWATPNTSLRLHEALENFAGNLDAVRDVLQRYREPFVGYTRELAAKQRVHPLPPR